MFNTNLYSTYVKSFEVVNDESVYLNLMLAIEKAFEEFYDAEEYSIKDIFINKIEVNGVDYWSASINENEYNGVSCSGKIFKKLDFLCIRALFAQFIADKEKNGKNLIRLYNDVARMVKEKWNEDDTIRSVSANEIYNEEMKLNISCGLDPYYGIDAEEGDSYLVA